MLLLIYFKVDNGTNVCGIEFNYNNNNSSGIDDEEDLRSIIGEDESNREVFYNDQIFRQLFLGFQVVSEEGRSVDPFALNLHQALNQKYSALILNFNPLTMIPHRWVDPEFEDEEDVSRDIDMEMEPSREVDIKMEMEPSQAINQRS